MQIEETTQPHERWYVSPDYAILNMHTAENYPYATNVSKHVIRRLSSRVRKAFPSAPHLFVIAPFHFPLAVLKNYTRSPQRDIYREMNIPTSAKLVHYMHKFMFYSEHEILKYTSVGKEHLPKLLKLANKYYARKR